MLNEKHLQEIMRQKKDSSVVYWDKIEDLLGATHTPFEDFLSWGMGKSRVDFSTSTTINQALIAYGQYGVEIKTRNPASSEKEFFYPAPH